MAARCSRGSLCCQASQLPAWALWLPAPLMSLRCGVPAYQLACILQIVSGCGTGAYDFNQSLVKSACLSRAELCVVWPLLSGKKPCASGKHLTTSVCLYPLMFTLAVKAGMKFLHPAAVMSICFSASACRAFEAVRRAI